MSVTRTCIQQSRLVKKITISWDTTLLPSCNFSSNLYKTNDLAMVKAESEWDKDLAHFTLFFETNIYHKNEALHVLRWEMNLFLDASSLTPVICNCFIWSILFMFSSQFSVFVTSNMFNWIKLRDKDYKTSSSLDLLCMINHVSVFCFQVWFNF